MKTMELSEPQYGNGSSVVAAHVNGCVVLTVPADLGGSALDELEEITLSAVTNMQATGVIFELAGVRFMDSYEFNRLRSIVRMSEYLGARSILVGLRPGIIAHLTLLDADISGVQATLDLDEALKKLSRHRA